MLTRSTLLLLALLAPARAAAQSFTPTNPDTGGSLLFGGAFELSNGGTLVGFGDFAGGPGNSPAFWNTSGSHPLPLLAGDDVGLALSVNEQGQAVGVSTDVVDTPTLTFFFDHPVWWKHGEALDLRNLVTGGANLELLFCTSIDEAERIAGSARLPGGSTGLRGFLFEDGVLTDLGDLNPGGSFAGTEVAAIGADGVILGSSTAPTSFMHAFAWKDGVMTDLHDFAQMPGRNSHAFDSNALGVICGSGDFGADFLDYETGALWDHGKIVNLGSLAPGEIWAQAFAFGINDLSQVVGATNLPSGEARAFFWENGVMSDLNAFLPPGSGWILTSAEDITNDGRIVGQGLFGGSLMPFLLLPDCQGGYTPYAAGCAGTGGFVPALAGMGCPSAGQPIGLSLSGGAGGAPGAYAVGLGESSLPITPACSLSIAPLTSILLPFVLGGAGAGQGAHLEVLTLPPGIGPLTVTVQAGILDTGVPGWISATNALSIAIP
jgi:probable HAF family extracellular repeat protein